MWSASVPLDMGQWSSMQYWWNVDIFEVTLWVYFSCLPQKGLANLNVNINSDIFVSWWSTEQYLI